MTQAEVEAKAKLSPRYLSNIERGRSVPSIDVLMQIANALNMTPDEVLLGADAASGPSLPQEWLQEKLETDIRRLDPQQQKQALSFIGWLKGQKSQS